MLRENRRMQFRYKLSLIFFLIVILISSFLGIFQYLQMHKVLYRNFDYDKSMVRNNVINAVKYADRFYYVVEKQYEPDARKILEEVRDKYQKTSIVNFDLKPYVAKYKNFDISIININNHIIASSEDLHLGLNYNNFYKYADLFKEIRKNGKFFSDRFNIAVNTSDVKKVCYLPSADGKYIFELEIKMKQFIDQLDGFGFDNFDASINNKDDYIDSVILYNSDGNSYKNANLEIPSHINYKYIGYMSQAMKTMKTVKFEGVFNDKTVTYEYIPYKIINANGINKLNIIELVFNDSSLTKNLNENIVVIVLAVIIGAVVSLLLGFYFASILSKPITKLNEATEKISKGDFNVAVGLSSQDEFGLLSNNFDKMAMAVSTLMELQKQKEFDLQQKNKEIFYQNEEISALYEETAAMNEELEDQLAINNKNYLETVSALASAIEAKDKYTGDHSGKVKEYSLGIAEILNLSNEELLELEYGSLLHDIGKIGIPEEILNKQARLSNEEYEMIKKHPTIGHDILKDVQFLENSQSIVYEHHERFDGKGYPNGLKGEEINHLARIVCIADAYDAMTSSRAYRRTPMSQKDAILELINNKGTQFDPVYVEALIKWLENQSYQQNT